MSSLIVVAIGGNALLRAGQPADVATQRANLAESTRHLAALAEHHRLVITHGNGPQVGLLALQSSADPDLAPYPLDVLDAESVGLIGYLILQAMSRHVEPSTLAAVLTRVEVDSRDSAFDTPTKQIGPWYPAERGNDLAAAHDWSMVRREDEVRRVVASPEPRRIIEIPAIEALTGTGHIVIAGGGGGIPVAYEDPVAREGYVGVEAVIDKDLTSSLLAIRLAADRLIVLTDVDAVYEGFGDTNARRMASTTAAELRELHFEPGTMGPKIEAVCRFVEQTGRRAAIGALGEAAAVMAGEAGTHVSL